MNLIKPVVLSFSLIAFTGAYAQDAKKEQRDTQARPPMTQSQQSPAAGTSAQSEPRPSGAAAGASTSPTERSAAAQTTDASGMSAKKLMDTNVVDAQGKDMGEIEDLVIDLQSGRVHAAVLSFGGFLGLGEKHYAFPVSELKSAQDKDKLSLNVDKDKLKDEQGFEKNKWPAMTDEYWSRVGTRDKASVGATAQQGQKPHLVRASKLIGTDVQDKSANEVGEVRDVMLSADKAKIQHIVVNVKGGGDAKVEPKSLSMAEDKLVIGMTAEQLKAQAGTRDRPAAAGGSRADERKSPRAQEKSKSNEKKY